VQVHVTDDARFEPYGAYVRLLARLRAQGGARFTWRTEAYEFVDTIPAIDLLTGGPEVRETIDAGGDVEALLEAEWAHVERFDSARRAWLLYPR
jgi:uncharacterized protein YbbC (DUF1343 family)